MTMKEKLATRENSFKVGSIGRDFRVSQVLWECFQVCL